MGLHLRRRLSRTRRHGGHRHAHGQHANHVDASRRDQPSDRREAHAALVLDGAGRHVAADLAVPDNITLVPLPPFAPELNPIENVWEHLRGNKLSITVYDSYEHIVDRACEAWMFFANDKDRVVSITTRQWAQVTI